MLCYPHERPSDAERTTLATGSDDLHGGGVRQDHGVPEEEGPADVYAPKEGDPRVRGEAPMTYTEPKWLQERFDLYNRTYFRGRLPRYRVKMSNDGLVGGAHV